MINRFNNYILNRIKVAIIGFCWLIPFHVPWESLPNAPIGGKLISAIMIWAIWSFMVMIVELKEDCGKVNTSKRGN